MALFIRASTNKSFLSFINKYKKLSINLLNLNRLPVITRQILLTDNSFKNSRNLGTLNTEYNQKNYENSSDENKDKESLGPFDTFVLQRRIQAKKTVIIQVHSTKSYADLYSYCQIFGPIEFIQTYVTPHHGVFFLIEFKYLSSFQALIKSATYNKINEIIPVESQMLWFRDVLQQNEEQELSVNLEKNNTVPPLPKYSKNPNKPITNDYIKSILNQNETVSEQMKLIYEESKLQDIDVRLRFLLANQIESSLSSLFSSLTVLPFGSSVNGFGKSDSDLDLSINIRTKSELPSSRLVFQSKLVKGDQRLSMTQILELISKLMNYTFPGTSKMINVLNARVPIIKYEHLYTGIDCDLSITNSSAVYMSELLYLFGEFNDKVRPLVYTIRLWASFVGLTNSKIPGPWISNFSLTLLVLFYLQQKKILPPINYLYEHARKSDIRIADSSVNCTFLRDLNKWPDSNCPNMTLEELLHDFYRYYAEFDFTTQALSLRKGESINKPNMNYTWLYICNPLETTLNVSRNVSCNEITGFVIAVQKAASLMDEGRQFYNRGLLDIFFEKQLTNKKYVIGQKKKQYQTFKVQIKQLFLLDEKKDGNGNHNNNKKKKIKDHNTNENNSLSNINNQNNNSNNNNNSDINDVSVNNLKPTQEPR